MNDVHTTALRDALVDHVSRTHRTRKMRGFAVVSGAVVTAAVVTVAFTRIQTAPAVDRGQLHCRSGASTNSTDVGVSAGVIDPQQAQRYGDAVENCAALWRQGILQPGPDYPADLPKLAKGQVPPMIICVDSSQTAVVVPAVNNAVCGARGLAQDATG
jgi:hypothetical protein